MSTLIVLDGVFGHNVMANQIFTIPNPTIAARFKVGAFDDANAQLAFQNGTAKISDASKGYLAQAGDGQIYFKPKSAGFPTTPGATVTVNIKINGQNAAGTPLPELQIDVVLQEPPVVGGATHFELTSGPEFNDTFPVPADPGTDTISIV